MMRRLSLLILIFMGLMPMYVATAQDSLSDGIQRCLATPNGEGCRAGLPTAYYQGLLDEMSMRVDPDVRPVPINDAEMGKWAYRRLTSPTGTTVYNGPNGAPIETIAAGFTFVKVLALQDGWVKIKEGQWVPESATAVTRASTFSGVILPSEGLEYTMAWVLIPTFPAAYPGGPGNEARPRLERYTRVNIFESVEVDGWRWYLVGPDAWIKQTSVAKVMFTERPEEVKGRWIAIDLYEQVLVAYDGDTPVFATLISSGLPDWATREGTFKTYWRLVNGYMTGSEGQSDYYLVDGVPYTMYFDEAISLHGTYWHDGFGYRHSHGCVNMTITDSQWLFNWTLDGGYELPYVHVFATGDYING